MTIRTTNVNKNGKEAVIITEYEEKMENGNILRVLEKSNGFVELAEMKDGTEIFSIGGNGDISYQFENFGASSKAKASEEESENLDSFDEEDETEIIEEVFDKNGNQIYIKYRDLFEGLTIRCWSKYDIYGNLVDAYSVYSDGGVYRHHKDIEYDRHGNITYFHDGFNWYRQEFDDANKIIRYEDDEVIQVTEYL